MKLNKSTIVKISKLYDVVLLTVPRIAFHVSNMSFRKLSIELAGTPKMY